MNEQARSSGKQRGARMSKHQQEVYVKFLEDNPDFSRGSHSQHYDYGARERDYDKLVEALNNTAGARKDKKQWQETFADWRSKLIKRYRYHYSEEGKHLVSERQIRSMKRFDDFDVRALKALGKWGNLSCLNSRPRNSGLSAKTRNARHLQETGEDEEEEEQEEEFDNDFFDLSESSDNFAAVNIKSEIDFDERLVHETPALPEVEVNEPQQPTLRKRKLENGESERDGVIEENTRAMKQHTAAIMGLTDSINALTATIRSYMYNK